MSVEIEDTFQFVPLKPPAVMDQKVFDFLGQFEMKNFELGGAWYSNLVLHGLSTKEKAYVAVLKESNGGMAVLPLRVSNCHRRAVSLSTFYTSLYLPAVQSNSLTQSSSQLFRKLKEGEGLAVLQLEPLDKDSDIYTSTLKALSLAGWVVFPYYCFGNWYMPVQWQNYAEYFAQRGSAVKNTVKRKKRKFLRGRRGRFELYMDKNSVERAIGDFLEIYARSWKKPEPFSEFVPNLIRMAAEKKWLRMGVAYYDDVPIAAQIWVVAHRRASIFKLAYDEAHKQLSVGTLLTDYLMNYVIDIDKVVEVDYLIGDDAYKKDWMTHRRERWGVIAFNPKTVGGAAGLLTEAGKRLVKRVLMYIGLKKR